MSFSAPHYVQTSYLCLVSYREREQGTSGAMETAVERVSVGSWQTDTVLLVFWEDNRRQSTVKMEGLSEAGLPEKALRDKISTKITDKKSIPGKARDVAQLAKRLPSVCKALDLIPSKG